MLYMTSTMSIVHMSVRHHRFETILHSSGSTLRDPKLLAIRHKTRLFFLRCSLVCVTCLAGFFNCLCGARILENPILTHESANHGTELNVGSYRNGESDTKLGEFLQVQSQSIPEPFPQEKNPCAEIFENNVKQLANIVKRGDSIYMSTVFIYFIWTPGPPKPLTRLPPPLTLKPPRHYLPPPLPENRTTFYDLDRSAAQYLSRVPRYFFIEPKILLRPPYSKSCPLSQDVAPYPRIFAVAPAPQKNAQEKIHVDLFKLETALVT